MPQCTASSNSEAEIATPTKLDMLLPVMDRAAPKPNGTAMAMKIHKAEDMLQFAISVFSHKCLQAGAVHSPQLKPIKMHRKRPKILNKQPHFMRTLWSMVAPIVTAMIGPIKGETSILAIMMTVLFIRRSIIKYE